MLKQLQKKLITQYRKNQLPKDWDMFDGLTRDRIVIIIKTLQEQYETNVKGAILLRPNGRISQKVIEGIYFYLGGYLVKEAYNHSPDMYLRVVEIGKPTSFKHPDTAFIKLGQLVMKYPSVFLEQENSLIALAIAVDADSQTRLTREQWKTLSQGLK